MRLNVRICLLYLLIAVAFFTSIYHRLPRELLSDDLVQVPGSFSLPIKPHRYRSNLAIHENHTDLQAGHYFSSITGDAESQFSTNSVLLPDWEILVVVSPDSTLFLDVTNKYDCLFQNNYTSPAVPSGLLAFPSRQTFKCLLPKVLRRRLPFLQPSLVPSSEKFKLMKSHTEKLQRWTDLTLDSFTTEEDVVLFVKGVNRRQGVNRSPTGLSCVFGDDPSRVVRTAVTSSMQEVFRCEHPDLNAVSRTLASGDEAEQPIKVSLEILDKNRIVPSVAYYTPRLMIPPIENKSHICACTMVYNVAKFLNEWVMYHSSIGVDKFILYDNDSDDGLQGVVKELLENGHDVETLFWPWPKAQEAGFSHCALFAEESCTWMMYVDVDEFVYSPKWNSSLSPSNSSSLLKSLLPSPTISDDEDEIGAIRIGCHEFGPSNQKSHPQKGVVQGYNCRRKMENRHKSIVRMEAINESLENAIHHFKLKQGYKEMKLSVGRAVVNHYKYQAWPEFKAKFRRRVSTYVKDWKEKGNPNSNDRTPGLGFAAIEPKDWPEKFCEVTDNTLKKLTRRWFAVESPDGNYSMTWQR